MSEKLIFVTDLLFSFCVDALSVTSIQDAFYFNKTKRFIREFRKKYPLICRLFGLYPWENCSAPFHFKLFYFVRIIVIFLVILSSIFCFFLDNSRFYHIFLIIKFLLFGCYVVYIMILPSCNKRIDFTRVKKK